jgi:hypothetical protein
MRGGGLRFIGPVTPFFQTKVQTEKTGRLTGNAL